MQNRWQPILPIIGVVAGTLSGFLGLGGGVVIVPSLSRGLRVPQRIAHGTSLTIIVPIALCGAVFYIIRGDIDWILVAELAGGGILGAIIGAKAMMKVPEHRLRQGVGILLLVSAILMLGGWG